ncbi:Os08g0441900 [Oryza sativa Japonica Group]|uniref:Os08g0441900 protein n=1 Tax=Oryza sativa subsp. japonica TaxID=39947 RepID=A0A0P0XG62_ORYSJ|nr:Os08g0441900 [Oryza sativa Japonica Group]
MEFARRATAPVDADDGCGVPHPSPRETKQRWGWGVSVQVTMDALRRELWEEGIRQEVIAAEIAEQRELEAKVQRDTGLLCDVPSRLSVSFQPVRGDTFPSPHGELWLGGPMAMPAGASMFRVPVKDRIEEWYRPPWDRTADEENASFNAAKMRRKVSSGVKRKRGADTFQMNNKKICVPRSCDGIQEHSAGHRNEENNALESRKEAIGTKKKVETESLSVTRHYPPTWNYGICKANCSSELDLKNHLRGRRHQENLEALKREDKEMEAKVYAKEVAQFVEKNQKFVPRWSCSTCKANCTSASDLENHFRGRRHQQNVGRSSNVVMLRA